MRIEPARPRCSAASLLGAALAGLACAAALIPLPARAAEPIVVLMLFDGFAPHYIERFETPSFDRMRERGAHARAMEPPFPSLSLIGGVTISTGCWPERHGIVSNLFLDPERGRYDHELEIDWLEGCEHLHQAAERQGIRSAALAWYGRTSLAGEPQASLIQPEAGGYSEYLQDLEQAEAVVALLSLPETERPRLILAYFRGPDSAGHATGIESGETRAAVERADAAVGRVMASIDAHSARDRIQLMVTTDHGMVPVTHLINVARILSRHDIDARAVSSGTSSFL